MKYIKVNPYIRVFDSIRDEKLDVIFNKNEWIEVKESDWSRLKDSETKQGDILLPTFVEKTDGMGEIKNFSPAEKVVEELKDDEWFDNSADVEVEEE